MMHKTAQYVVLSGLLAVFICALYIVARSYWNQRKDYVRTQPAALSSHPEKTGIPGLREIAFSVSEGPTIASWYAPPANTRAAVLLIHGVDSDRSSLLFEARALAQAGFGVLALDLPGQGASGGTTMWGVPERRAIGAAVDWLSERGEIDPQRIGAFGMSMGAYVLAQAAVADSRLSAVILAASPNDVVEFNWLATRRFGWLSQVPNYLALRAGGTPVDMLPKDILGQLAPRPVLILNGDQDPLVPEWMARQLYDTAREPKELYIVRGAHHADYATAAPLEYRSRLIDFYRKTLLRGS